MVRWNINGCRMKSIATEGTIYHQTRFGRENGENGLPMKIGLAKWMAIDLIASAAWPMLCRASH